MILRWRLLWAAAIAAVAGLVVWRNLRLYPKKHWHFHCWKSLVDTLLVVGLAWKFPVLLVVWTVTWLTRPIKTKIVQVSVGVGLGYIMMVCSATVFEVIVLLSILAIDQVSGTAWQYWQQAGKEETMVRAA